MNAVKASRLRYEETIFNNSPGVAPASTQALVLVTKGGESGVIGMRGGGNEVDKKGEDGVRCKERGPVGNAVSRPSPRSRTA